MNDYEQRQEQRRARLERAADRASTASDARLEAGRRAFEQMDGQPILIGHHSEKRHRRAIDRANNSIHRGLELEKEARELARRAAAVGTGGISSDDPDAVEKLTDKRTDLEQERDRMKAINAHARKHQGSLDTLEPPLTDEERREIDRNLRFSSGTRTKPFPSWSLQNLGARVRDAKKRADRLERGPAVTAGEEQVNGATIVVDTDDNRVLLRFPVRLSREDYKRVRSYGFVWSPTRTAFVRKLTAVAVDYARNLARAIGEGQCRA